MTAFQHIYVTAHGSFATGPWVGEGAQFGLRLAIADSTNMPEKGTTFEPLVNGDVVTDQGTQSGTHGTLTRTWTARLAGVGSDENADAAFQIDLAEDIWTFLDAIKAYEQSTFRWNAVKIAPVSAAGNTIGTSSVYQFTSPLQPTASSLLPPQLAMALTMRANILGRRGRGRIYLPALATTVLQSDGTINAAASTPIRAAFATLISNLQDAPGINVFNPLVVITSAGQSTVVRPSEVRTGQRADTIRSRREQVPETYTSTAL